MTAAEQTRRNVPVIHPPADHLSDAEKLQVLWLTVFGSQRPPVRGLVDAFAELDEIKKELSKLASTRRFVLQLLAQMAAIATAAGVVIAALK
jgi:hypothetical protein